jgi:prepilin-type processing-associated H-X9-DG protein
MPAAAGEVRIQASLGLRDWLKGAYVMRGARVERLNGRLGLDGVVIPELYLADADVLVVFGSRNAAPVVAHVSADVERLQRYQRLAGLAQRVLATHGMSAIVPAVLEQRSALGWHILVQQRLKGRKVLASDLSPESLEAHVEAALKPLRALASGGALVPTGADTELIDSTLSGLARHREISDLVKAPLEALTGWQGRWTLPAILVHGDYCFANILFADGSEPTVSAVLDWERARLNACPGFDGLYLVVFSYAHWRGIAEMQVLCSLWSNSFEPQLERLVGKVQAALGLTAEDLRFAALAIWLRHLHQHAPDMAEWSAERRRDWLDEPARCAEQWLRASGMALGGRDQVSIPASGAPI